MSAYLVESAHVAYLAQFAALDDHGRYKDPAITAALLARANLASLSARYGDDDDPAFVAACVADARDLYWRQFEPWQVIAACDCLDYQSCEVRDWESSEAARCIRAIRDYAISRLPGAGSGKWGAPEPDGRRQVAPKRKAAPAPRQAAPARARGATNSPGAVWGHLTIVK